MTHPTITKTLQPINPPLEPGETLEVYFAATHKMDPPKRHAFSIAIYRSSQPQEAPNYAIIMPKLEAWPRVRILPLQRDAEGLTHVARRDKALRLANARVN